MTKKPVDTDIEVPKWDVALAALALEEYTKQGTGLTIDDFKRLAVAHATRFDDIIATIMELTLAKQWQYREADGKARRFMRKDVNDLYVGGRIHEKDMAPFTGRWSPVT